MENAHIRINEIKVELAKATLGSTGVSGLDNFDTLAKGLAKELGTILTSDGVNGYVMGDAAEVLRFGATLRYVNGYRTAGSGHFIAELANAAISSTPAAHYAVTELKGIMLAGRSTDMFDAGHVLRYIAIKEGSKGSMNAVTALAEVVLEGGIEASGNALGHLGEAIPMLSRPEQLRRGASILEEAQVYFHRRELNVRNLDAKARLNVLMEQERAAAGLGRGITPPQSKEAQAPHKSAKPS